MERKHVTLSEFLTEGQIIDVIKAGTASAICERVIRPNIAEINRKLGQENDPMYLAYACEYAITQARKR